MHKVNGIPRKTFDVMTICKKKKINGIDINQHPNGKLTLPGIKKKEALKILRIKGYL